MRIDHAATCVSGPVLMMMGGFDLIRQTFDYLDPVTLSECWICDTTAMLWKKVCFVPTAGIIHTTKAI